MSAIGDLVATLGVDSGPWKSGLMGAATEAQLFGERTEKSFRGAYGELNLFGSKLPAFGGELGEAGERMEQAAGHGHSLFRAENAAGHGVEMLGRALTAVNPALGESVFMMGEGVRMVGQVSHAYAGLQTILESATAAQIGFDLVSGPSGWATWPPPVWPLPESLWHPTAAK